jgi:hypothetical protein
MPVIRNKIIHNKEDSQQYITHSVLNVTTYMHVWMLY